MKTLLSFLLLLSFVAMVSAQEQVIDKTEFDTLVAEGQMHKLKWKGEKYRMTIMTSSKISGRPQTDFSSKVIIEYGPSTDTRRLQTSTYGSKPSDPIEIVRIGDWVYTRSGNNAWVRKEFAASTAEGDGKGLDASPQKKLSSQAEYKFLGQEKFRDGMAKIYEKTERRTMLNEKTGETSESDMKSTYWVDEKGMVLKNEFRSETRGKTTHETTVYLEWELDPSITIAAPKIDP